MALADALAAAAVDAAYLAWGRSASYSPPGGGSSARCTVLLDIRDSSAKPEDGSPPAGQAWIEVRAREVAAPAAGGTFTMTIGGKVYAVASRPLPADGDGYAWKMWVE
ncbi:hypothetical protein IVB45_17505 [Bradyrhizobium sp. 4]|uniref:head-tail joining protein n=1 Tax=unclassified Bradyrhizobium TaxID=2631580 RepID=UPI001FF9BE34|nr:MULTISPECIES: hypothetical protein [unclassified Bradyrhizobium]MCK1402028.1 hypothetical protein [Bradyrhizobium sp. 39]MCK1751252.1 hypothetical protein [Bradyrhizobium sp. 135]UPJ38505.1 hypothetical protein IVB45_17505 [Bradyrhizobium sp. 4]